MAFVPVPNVAQVEIVYLVGGQVMEVVLHYAGNDVSNPTVLTGLANDAMTQWRNSWVNLTSTGAEVTKIKATSLEAQNSPGVEVPFSDLNHGSVSGDLLPLNCAFLIQKITAYRGRSYRGRIYLPGVTESQSVGSTINSTSINLMNNSYAYWDFLDVSGEPYALVVVSRFHNGAPRAEGIYTPVDAFAASQYVASQRRREPGRGV